MPFLAQAEHAPSRVGAAESCGQELGLAGQFPSRPCPSLAV